MSLDIQTIEIEPTPESLASALSLSRQLSDFPRTAAKDGDENEVLNQLERRGAAVPIDSGPFQAGRHVSSTFQLSY